MSETSRSRVTITLGRTGQVVKRAGSGLDSSFSDLHPVAGSKRSVRERLGNNVDSSSQVNKRIRADGRTTDAVDEDMGLSKNDLRYKIMQKKIQKQSKNSQQNGVDLRNILSRPAQPPAVGRDTWDRIPLPKDTRPHYIETSDGRQHFLVARDGRHLLPVNRNSSPYIPEFRSEYTPDPRRHNILESRERGIIEAKDFRPRLPEARTPSMMADIPGMRASNVNSRSPWTLENLRRRSPDESLPPSRSAPKREEILHRGFTSRAYDDARTSTYMSKDTFEVSRPMSSSNLARVAPTVGQMKAMAPPATSLPLSASLAPKSSYVVDDQVSVDSFLCSLGLEKLSIVFKAEEVDMYSLKRMAERDLKEMGIPMGPRKKILLALQPRPKPQT